MSHHLSRSLSILCFALATLVAATAGAAGENETTLTSQSPLLMQHPTINRDYIVFAFAGDLWKVPKGGGKAINLTNGGGVASAPVFSPDGTKLAFTWEVGGNPDVYVIDMSRKELPPKRLTFHPSPDTVVGWTPDSKQVIFRSPRSYAFQFQSLFIIPENGGAETQLPLPMGYDAAYSPDGSHLAYVPTEPKVYYVKRYKGGRTTPIWIARLSDSTIKEIPHGDFTDINPIWVGDHIYFLSSRSGPVTLFDYDVRTGTVTKCFENTGFDLKSAQYGFGTIVYEQLGSIHLFDPVTKKDSVVDVEMSGSFPETATRDLPLEPEIKKASISSTGSVAFEARGEILTFDPQSSTVQNLTSSPGVMDRDPAWSPDGSKLAYFSDESGEYALYIRTISAGDQAHPQKVALAPGFFEYPQWSPDGNKIAFRDNNQQLWFVDLSTGKAQLVSTEAQKSFAWAPDGSALAFSKYLKNGVCGLFVYRLNTAETLQVTDGLEEATDPVFIGQSDRVYFLGSTMAGWKRGGGLSADQAKSEQRPYECDLRNNKNSIKALAIPSRDYDRLLPGSDHSILVMEHTGGGLFEPGVFSIYEYDLNSKEAPRLADNVSDIKMAGENILLSRDGHWSLLRRGKPFSSATQLNLGNAKVHVDPKAEWNQMYLEFWRLVRDFTYDPNLHGLNWSVLSDRYKPFMAGVMTRDDFNYLAFELEGTMTTSHLKFYGGDRPIQKPVPVGLLGADFNVESDRYRISKIFSGDPWKAENEWPPMPHPPFADTDVQAGDYLIAINGKNIQASQNLFSFLENTTGKKITITVSKDPNGKSPRDVQVEPISNEFSLRQADWIETNRRRVDEASGGRVAYIYVPDTLSSGFHRFNRYFYSQVDKEALIIDIRFIPGGALPDYFVDRMAQPILSLGIRRGDSQASISPPNIRGPRALLINEYAGSGGDAFASYFREMALGKIIGKRTWGGLTGAFDTPEMMDGTDPEVPNAAIFQPSGRMEVENFGVPPDQEVELDPASVRKGDDPQLQAAISYVMSVLKDKPPSKPQLVYPTFK